MNKIKNLAFLALFSLAILPSVGSAKSFNIKQAVAKCQKCHGVKFDKHVLNASKSISNLSKKELLASFDRYVKGKSGGREGLMKIILKKHTKKQRTEIATYISKLTK